MFETSHSARALCCALLLSFSMFVVTGVVAGHVLAASLLNDSGNKSEWDGLTFRAQEVRYKFGEADGVCEDLMFPPIYATPTRIYTRWQHSLSNGSLSVALVDGNLRTSFDGLRVSSAHITASKHDASVYLKVKVYSRESTCNFALLFEDVLIAE